MSEDLRQKIIDIICTAWPTPDGYLLGSDVHDRLRSQGFEVTEATLNTVLSELATSGRITLTLMPGAGDLDQALAESGAAIHDIEDDLCE
jgi:hypothetical protein